MEGKMVMYTTSITQSPLLSTGSASRDSAGGDILGWATYTAVMTFASIIFPGAGFLVGLLFAIGAAGISSWLNTKAGEFWKENISTIF